MDASITCEPIKICECGKLSLWGKGLITGASSVHPIIDARGSDLYWACSHCHDRLTGITRRGGFTFGDGTLTPTPHEIAAADQFYESIHGVSALSPVSPYSPLPMSATHAPDPR